MIENKDKLIDFLVDRKVIHGEKLGETYHDMAFGKNIMLPISQNFFSKYPFTERIQAFFDIMAKYYPPSI